ncbi:PTS sugar transporter subunit IIA [Chromatium okenii]|jgi:PTS system ascorbate-specific IIA component|uniref:PTS sugar transporter subunit IIA n=1 Tax=Chromatium okenii TaxID=61644 RepID=UPI0026EA4625|nr:PTS fructose transporter subunit IIA [Chromatium okenii]MBV5310059.1 PTS fructose transporter subunit IIA [Chromatium okenii]
MTVGIVLITHCPLAGGLLRVAADVLGTYPSNVETVEVINDTPCETLIAEGLRCLTEVDQGDGVLILTDLFGATPANVALQLLAQREQVRVLTGINLPMLLRALNYAHLTLDAVSEKACAGGRDGVRLCATTTTDQCQTPTAGAPKP